MFFLADFCDFLFFAILSVAVLCASFLRQQLAETFVTSSGSADGFETYDFDVFTDTVAIAGIFASNGQSITISEASYLHS